MHFPRKLKEALLIIFLTGLPVGLFYWIIPFPDSWLFSCLASLFFGIFQYFAYLFTKTVSKNNFRHDIFIFTILAGCIIGGIIFYLYIRFPVDDWEQILSPGEDAVDITFATTNFYCLELTSGEKTCCGYIEDYQTASCVPDTYSENQTKLNDSFYSVIDNKNHLLFLPRKPAKSIDVYYVYSGYFEGTDQDIYLLANNGDVWHYNVGLGGSIMELYLITFIALASGLIGLLHSIIQVIIMNLNEKRSQKIENYSGMEE